MIKLLGIIVVLIFAGVFWLPDRKDVGPDGQNIMSLRDYLVASFVAELPAINKNLPYKVDENTSLLSIQYLENKVVSRYELTLGSGADELKSALVKRALPFLQRQTCEDEFKRKLMDVDVVFLNKYQTLTGELIFEIEISKESCSVLAQ